MVDSSGTVTEQSMSSVTTQTNALATIPGVAATVFWCGAGLGTLVTSHTSPLALNFIASSLSLFGSSAVTCNAMIGGADGTCALPRCCFVYVVCSLVGLCM